MEKRLRERVLSVGKTTQRIRWRAVGPLGVLIGLLLCSLCALATSYVYDAGGRLVAVSNDTGGSARYTYDNIGNLVAVDRIAGQLAIFAFSPGRGAPGTPVTIKGQGFSATASQNAVQFNGVAATVSTASSTELTVVVPSGATTGPIAITVGSATASTAMNFVVDAAAMAPTIDTVAPTLLAIGESVTTTGKGFLPAQGQTSTLLNARAVSPTTLSNTTIVFPAPANVGSGKVAITTPYGSATSAQDVVVVPAGIDKTQIESIKRLTIGAAPQAMSVTTAGNSLAVLYDLTAGDYPSLQFSGLGAVSVSYSVYDPTNTKQVFSGSVSVASTASVHLPRVGISGTYLVLLTPSQAPATWQFAVENATPLNVNGAPLTQPIIGTAQSKRFVFNAAKGQNLDLGLSEIVTPNTKSGIYWQVFGSDGTLLASDHCYAYKQGCEVNLSTLPNIAIATGTYTYTAVVSPPSDGDQTMQFTATLSADLADSAPVDGTPRSYATAEPGQYVYLSFTATAGQNLGFALSDIVTPNATSYVYLQVSGPSYVGPQYCYASYHGCQVNLSNLAAGTYTVVMSPPSDGDQTMQFTATLSTDLADSLPLNTAKAMSLTRRGQNARLSFNGKAGQQGLALQVSGQSTAPANADVYYTVYAPDGSQVNSIVLTGSGGGTLNLSRLPVDGSYTVFVDPYYGETANATVLLSTPITGTTPIDGTPGSYATTEPGQNVYLSFTATAGQNLGFALSDIVTPNAASPILLQVSDSAGTFVVGKYCYVGNNGCQVNLSNLAGGTYTVVMSPPSDGDQTMQFTATLSADLVDSLPLNTAKTMSLTRRGQNARLSFSGTAGQQGLALSVSGQSTVPANGHVDYTVYAPDGSQVSSTVNNTVISTSGILNLPKLQMTGTYTVFVDPASGETANTTVQLSSPMTGTMPVDGTTGIYATTVPGQNVYLSFTATAGQSLGLGLSDIVMPNAVTSMSLKVFDPAGNMLYSQPCYATDNGCQVNLSNLAGGTYTALVSPPWDGDQTMQFKATLSTDLTDQLTPGTAKSVNITRRGQNARLSFNGTAGQPAVTLGISGQTTGPANSVVYYVVYGPDGSQLNSIALRTDGKLNLGTLPATGTYTVFVDPSYGETASATILLSSAITGTLPVDGTPGSYVTTVPGQKVYLSFNATAGQNLGFALSDIVTSSTTSDLDLNLFDPSGNSVDSQGCMAVKDGCALNLRSLVGGTYTVVVSPPLDGDRKMKFTATLSTDLTDSLTPGTAKAVSLTRRGQNARLSFNGKVGQTLALRVSGETTVPVGRDVHYIVYAPDGSQVNDMWVSSTSGSGAMNLPTLPSDGTYMVFVDPFYGETANATVLLSSVITGTASVDGTPGSYSTTVPGQSVYLSFDVTSNGQNLGFALSDIVTPNSTSNLSLQVIDFVGNTMISQSCFAANNGCQVNLPNLIGGTYSVVVSPPSDGDQTMKFTSTLSSDLADSLTLGTAKSVSLTRRGQNARLSFNGTAGQQSLVLNVSGQSTVPAARGVYYTVYAPDGSQLNSASITASGSVNLPKLPATGTYMVFVDPGYGETASASLLLSSSSAITGTVPVDGTSGNYTTTMSGQKVALSFTATAGQNLGFALSDIVTPNTTSNLSLQIADSAGNVVGSQTCAAANNGCQVNLSSLKAGTYSAVMSPPTNGNQTMKFTATLSSDLADSLTLGTAKAVSLTRRGQNARLSFSGTAGQQGLTLQVSGQSTVPTARGVYYTVYAPDGSQLNSASITASGSVNLSKLPTTGTYMVFVDPGYGETASASLLLSSAAAITGTVPVNGTPGSYATTAPGQKVALSFTATAGQNLGFALSDIVTSNTTSTIALQITDSAGNAVGSQTCAAANNGCQVNLSNLKASTYSAVVSPPSAGDQTMKFTATLSTDLTDSLVPSTAKAVSLTRRGQNSRLSFSGTAGQQGLALRVSGQSTVPASRTVDYTVYAPDGSQLNTQSVATSGTLNLSKLPATGTYTVFVDPHYGETASASVLLASAITGTVVVNGTPGSSATTVPGQKVYLSFTATAGQNLGFALSDVVTSNTTSTMSLQIADPTGNAVSSQTCAAANNGCQVNLSNLKAGTYSVVLSPPPDGDQTMKFTSTLSTDLTDRLVLGTAKAVSLTRRGQNTRLSFSGTAGQQGLTLRVSAQSTVPASRAVDYTVYAPDGSLLNTVSVSASGSLTLSKLSTTGTYTVFVDPHYGETVSSQLLVGTSTRSHAKDISHANP